jgi:acetyltransferase
MAGMPGRRPSVAHITRLGEFEARAHVEHLIALLADTVNNGASVGFLRPLSTRLARDYWLEVCDAVAARTKVLLIARMEDEIAGSVQLDLATRQNGPHRAEVQKLIVLTRYRRRGIASALMETIQGEASAAGRSLLVLDTEAQSGAEPFYESLHWQRVGSIPGFALNTDGVPTPNTIYYKRI